jgi:hypothetical protein
MPKAAGGSMTMIRTPGKSTPTRGIKHQVPPPSPRLRPASPGVSKQADQLKQSSGGPDPRQMVPEMSARNRRY